MTKLGDDEIDVDDDAPLVTDVRVSDTLADHPYDTDTDPFGRLPLIGFVTLVVPEFVCALGVMLHPLLVLTLKLTFAVQVFTPPPIGSDAVADAEKVCPFIGKLVCGMPKMELKSVPFLVRPELKPSGLPSANAIKY